MMDENGIECDNCGFENAPQTQSCIICKHGLPMNALVMNTDPLLPAVDMYEGTQNSLTESVPEKPAEYGTDALADEQSIADFQVSQPILEPVYSFDKNPSTLKTLGIVCVIVLMYVIVFLAGVGLMTLISFYRNA